MSMKKLVFSPKLFLTLLVILFQMKQFYAMTWIHHGLTIRTLIKEKNTALNRYSNNSSNLELKRLWKFLQENLNNSAESSKQRYYCQMANKLNNLQENSSF